MNRKPQLFKYLMISMLTLMTTMIIGCQFQLAAPGTDLPIQVDDAEVELLDDPQLSRSGRTTYLPELSATTSESTTAPVLELTATPKLTAMPAPTATPEPTATPAPTATPEPTATPAPTATPNPTAAPAPTATPKPTAVPALTATPVPPNPDNTSADVWIREVLRLTNEIRVANGLQAFSAPSTALVKAAAIRGTEQAEFYNHTRPDGRSCFTVLDDCGVAYTCAGENIAMGSAGAFTPAYIVQMWMDSDGHRKNILNPAFTSMGVGYGQDDPDEAKQYEYFVQLFIGS